VTILRVPYHLDEYLPDLDPPLEAAETITAGLPSGDTWARLTVPSRHPAVGRTGLDGRPVPVEQDTHRTPALMLLAGQLAEPFQARD
jgi:arginase